MFLSISSRAPGIGLLPGATQIARIRGYTARMEGIYRSFRQPQSIGQRCGPERSLGAMAICILWCAITLSVSLPHNEIDYFFSEPPRVSCAHPLKCGDCIVPGGVTADLVSRCCECARLCLE